VIDIDFSSRCADDAYQHGRYLWFTSQYENQPTLPTRGLSCSPITEAARRTTHRQGRP
jgi:hypothetical protein